MGIARVLTSILESARATATLATAQQIVFQVNNYGEDTLVRKTLKLLRRNFSKYSCTVFKFSTEIPQLKLELYQSGATWLEVGVRNAYENLSPSDKAVFQYATLLRYDAVRKQSMNVKYEGVVLIYLQ